MGHPAFVASKASSNADLAEYAFFPSVCEGSQVLERVLRLQLLSLENPVRDAGAETIRAQGTVLEIGPVLVFVVDRPDGEAMVVNV